MLEFEEFYQEYVDKVYKFFYIHCLNRHVAEDLTSQVFIAFMEKSKTEEIKRQKEYLYGIMRNLWIEYLKQKYKQNIMNVENVDDFVSYSEQIVDEFEMSDVPARAEKYLQKLPAKQQQVARMRFIENKSLREVADVLGKNVRYVKTTQNRAMNTLRELFKEPIIEPKGET